MEEVIKTGKSHMKVEENLFLIFNSYLGYIAKKNRIDSQLPEKIKKMLFNNTPASISASNQKFDFSLVSDSEKMIRFSFNDFGERKDSYAKYLKVYSLFPENCDLEKINAIFGAVPQDSKHQTTFGIELGKDEKKTRVKLYFEDMEYSNKDILNLLKRICTVISYDFNGIYSKMKGMDIGAIGIDFLYGRKINLKIYTKHKKVYSKGKNQLARKFLEAFPEKENEFYFLTYRFSDSKLDSVKTYKVFNIIRDNMEGNQNLTRIKELLPGAGKTELMKEVCNGERFMERSNLDMIPVLLSAEPNGRIAFYFTIRSKKIWPAILCKPKEI